MFTSKWFKQSEFACKCGCGFNEIDPSLVESLDRIRETMGKPIIVNCGCRCVKHNKDVGGEENSAHLRGKAADIQVKTSTYRFAFLLLAFRNFKRIGIYKEFIHVDVDQNLPQFTVWTGGLE